MDESQFALDIAARHNDDSAEDVVARAEKYREFLRSGSEPRF